MKFSVNQQDLQKSLGYCQGVIEKRSSLPILSNVLLEINSGSLTITATDLDLIFIHKISDVEILEEGKSIGLDFGDNLLLKKYSRKRMIDKNILIQSTHNLNKLFSNRLFLLSAVRKIGLRVFNKSRFLKKQSMLFAMGLLNLEF